MFLDTFYIEINCTWKASHELAFFRAKKNRYVWSSKQIIMLFICRYSFYVRCIRKIFVSSIATLLSTWLKFDKNGCVITLQIKLLLMLRWPFYQWRLGQFFQKSTSSLSCSSFKIWLINASSSGFCTPKYSVNFREFRDLI